MRRTLLTIAMVLATAVTLACQDRSAESPRDEIIAIERAALDRWGKGDPQGYLQVMADGVSYFDPTQEKRIDGLDAMKTMLAPITGKVKVSRFDMIEPRVQHHGDAALLTFNLTSYVRQPDGQERAVARWNSSEMYARIGGEWRIVHSHWSYIKPELKQPVTELQ
jgi:ketosteroid isomerase-like protein